MKRHSTPRGPNEQRRVATGSPEAAVPEGGAVFREPPPSSRVGHESLRGEYEELDGKL